MASPITWRNVAAPDGAASIREFRQAGQDLGQAFKGLGQVVSTYGDQKADIETEGFIADLNNAPDDQTRQKMIQEASKAFLNMGEVTKAQRSAELHDQNRTRFGNEQTRFEWDTTRAAEELRRIPTEGAIYDMKSEDALTHYGSDQALRRAMDQLNFDTKQKLDPQRILQAKLGNEATAENIRHNGVMNSYTESDAGRNDTSASTLAANDQQVQEQLAIIADASQSETARREAIGRVNGILGQGRVSPDIAAIATRTAQETLASTGARSDGGQSAVLLENILGAAGTGWNSGNVDAVTDSPTNTRGLLEDAMAKQVRAEPGNASLTQAQISSIVKNRIAQNGAVSAFLAAADKKDAHVADLTAIDKASDLAAKKVENDALEKLRTQSYGSFATDIVKRVRADQGIELDAVKVSKIVRTLHSRAKLALTGSGLSERAINLAVLKTLNNTVGDYDRLDPNDLTLPGADPDSISITDVTELNKPNLVDAVISNLLPSEKGQVDREAAIKALMDKSKGK